MSSVPTPFKRIKTRFQLLRLTEILLWSTAFSLLAFYIARLFTVSAIIPLAAAVVFGCFILAIGSYRLRIFAIKEQELAAYLNRQYPQLQESADLLLKSDHQLAPLQLVQKNKVHQTFEQLYPTIKIPHHVLLAAAVLSGSILVSFFLSSYDSTPTMQSGSAQRSHVINPPGKPLPASIKALNISISPPAYTKRAPEIVNDFELHIAEGSGIEWQITFDREISNPRTIFSGRDSVALFAVNKDYTFKRTLTSSGFYQLSWNNADGIVKYTDFFQIDVLNDQPPSIAVENLDQFTEVTSNDKLTRALKATLTDDYGLSGSNIIATVSKGSGEAIKFREEKLAFTNPQKIEGNKIVASRTIDLIKLGLQPGDELYFYIEASDNKVPVRNHSRTETYFIAWQDTSSVMTSVDASLGVDLMPEYFRSQRQIIIDSEKLLREEKRITKQQFNDRSNALAHDQKVLRLRYGEFLGEEFETAIGPSGQGHDNEESIERKFGHDHDKDNEHNLVEEIQPLSKKEDPIKDFIHAHDRDEEATFFTQSIKAKLKAAVTIMWDAELYLRLYQPGKSLPYQYKALKLLKEISQDSRIYVHRTGFDPPPLKEEKRLTGDMDEIKNSSSIISGEIGLVYPHIRMAIRAVEKLLLHDSIVLSAPDKILLANAGREIAGIERIQPGRYLKTLSWIQTVMRNDTGQKELKSNLRNIHVSLWRVLPQQPLSPQARSGVVHDLDKAFLNSLQSSQENK